MFQFPYQKETMMDPQMMIKNICWIWFSFNNKIFWTPNMRLIYSSTFRLSLWWIRFSNIRDWKKTIGKRYWLEWIIIISSWSSYKRMWTRNSKDNSFTKLVNQLPYVLLILICEKTFSMVLDATMLQYLIILVA